MRFPNIEAARKQQRSRQEDADYDADGYSTKGRIHMSDRLFDAEVQLTGALDFLGLPLVVAARDMLEALHQAKGMLQCSETYGPDGRCTCEGCAVKALVRAAIEKASVSNITPGAQEDG